MRPLLRLLLPAALLTQASLGSPLLAAGPPAGTPPVEATAAASVTDLWWIGGNGNAWTTAANWSTTDPALGAPTPAASPPSTATNVHFTDASFPSGGNHSVSGSGTINCRDFNVTGLNGATLSITNISINVYGGAQLLDVVDGLTFRGNLDFKATSPGHTVDLGDQVTNGRLSFDGPGGTWTFVEGVTGARIFSLLNGHVDFGDHDYHFSGFTSGGTATRAIDYGASTFTLDWHVGGVHGVSGPMAHRRGTPSFTLVNAGNFSDLSTSPEVLAIQKVEKLSLSRPIIKLDASQTSLDSLVLHETGFHLDRDATIGYVEVGGEENTDLNARTLTVGEFVTNLDCGYHDVNTGTIDFLAAPGPIAHVQLRGVTGLVAGAAPATPIAANPGLDKGTNSGFAFTADVAREMYWIGNTGDWHEVANWSYASGGPALAATDCPPTILDNVYFDANSFDADGQAMSIANFTASCNNMTWDGLDQTGIDWTGNRVLKLGGDLTLDANMQELLTYTGPLHLIDPVDGVLDFKSGPDHRQLINCAAVSQIESTYRQVSKRVTFRSLSMGNHASASYDFGGNQDTLHLSSLSYNGAIDMTDAVLVVTGQGRAVWRVARPIAFDANSHVYVTNATSTSFDESPATFPSITQTSPTGVLSHRLRDLSVDGDITVNGSLAAGMGITATGTVTLAENRTHLLTGGRTYAMDSLVCVASSCNTGATIATATTNTLQAKLDLPRTHADVRFATITKVDYIGDASPLQLAGLFNIDAADNTNIDFGGSSAKTFYWRASGTDGSYTGDWGSPFNWSLDPVSATGQTDPLGCTPSAIDTVIFDALSGDGAAATVTISNGQLVNTVIWEEGQTPANLTWAVTATGTLTLTGQLTLASNVTADFDDVATFYLNGTDTTRVTTAGVDVDGRFVLENGVKVLEGPLTGSADIDVRSGTFDAQGHDMTLGSFRSDVAGSTRVIDVSDSHITLTETQRIGASTYNFYYAWHLHNTTGLTYLGEGTDIHIVGGANASFKGGGYVYNGVVIEELTHIVDDNTFADSLVLKGAATFFGNNTIKKLSLRASTTNVDYVFPAGGTTTFLPGATFDKNGQLEQFVNLKSSTTGSLHAFAKTEGGAMYICNINVTDITAASVPFKTNDASTYNGKSGSDPALSLPAGSSWDFDVSATVPDITMDEAAEVHYNRGDSVAVAWTITGNDSGPFQVDYTIDAGTVTVDKLADGGTTRDTILVGIDHSADVVISNIRYFDCPGVYNPGNITASTTPLRVPPVSTGLAADGATEDYTLRNLNSYVYLMDGGDRSATGTYDSRNTQVAVKDYTGAGDTDALGFVTAATAIDADELTDGTQRFLMRHYALSTAGTDAAARVKLFFSAEEMDSLKAAVNSTLSDAAFLASLQAVRQTTGQTPATESGQPLTVLSSGLASEVGPTVYYLEVSTAAFAGDYFIAADIPCTTNELAVSGATTTVDQVCDRGTWSYYYAADNPSKALFAIEHKPAGGNTADFTADVHITVTADATVAAGSHDVIDAPALEGNFVMGRHWNVDVTSGALNGPVNVRFFYDQVEMDATLAEANAYAATDASLLVTAPIWFKTIGTAFDATQVSARAIANGEVVTFESPATGTEDGVSYVQLDGLTSFSGGGVAFRVSAEPGAAVPVQLVNFGAAAGDCANAVTWSTATEANFSHFELERASDAADFRAIYTAPAAGAGRYDFTDASPAATSYYRLRSVDVDGSASYSDVVTVVSDCAAAAAEMIIAPNPVSAGHELSIALTAPAQAGTLTVLDLLGRPVHHETLAPGQTAVRLSTLSLAPASYVLRLRDGAHVATQKLVVR